MHERVRQKQQQDYPLWIRDLCVVIDLEKYATFVQKMCLWNHSNKRVAIGNCLWFLVCGEQLMDHLN